MDYKAKLLTGAKELGIELADKELNSFINYMEILQSWNQKMNLTALDTPEEIVIKHFLDSLSCVKGMNLRGDEKVIDVGTGAGFPGIPLKIIYPNLRLTLLDSLQKRIKFLKHLGDELGLNNLEFIHGRAEDYGQSSDYREQYDYALARAVASLNVLSEYTLPFLRVGGVFLSQRGSSVKEDIINSQDAVDNLGGEIYDMLNINLPYSNAERNLVIIDKVSNTPTKYPRRAGKPNKRPL